MGHESDQESPAKKPEKHITPEEAKQLFARVDHRPTGWYVKGLAGLGRAGDGHIDDLDFFAGGTKFSDTTSNVDKGAITLAWVSKFSSDT